MKLTDEELRKIMMPIEERVRHAYNKGYEAGIKDACSNINVDSLREHIINAIYGELKGAAK